MCMGEICQVIGLESAGKVRVRGEQREQIVSLMTLEQDAQVGDWLVIHSGFALGRLDPEEADEALALRSGSTRPLLTHLDSAPAVPVPALVESAEHQPPNSSTEVFA
jgi:hydrogenase expression/formation protein HypC